MKKFWKALSIILYVIMIAITLWVTVSWMDIIADNNRPNPSHYDWNFFTVIFNND